MVHTSRLFHSSLTSELAQSCLFNSDALWTELIDVIFPSTNKFLVMGNNPSAESE